MRIKTWDERVAHFWSKVDRSSGADACWIWLAGSDGRSGDASYGQFWTGSRMVGAHRFSFLLSHGYLPAGVILHACDNGKCVNPEHLREGTQKQNMEDCARKGRKKAAAARGSRIASAKLDEEDVQSIRLLLSFGDSLRSIARTFGVTHFTIAAIRDGKHWSHV